MKIDSNENIFMFKFYSAKGQFEYTVYSIGRENMIKFLQHHNLMMFINNIEYCDDSERDEIDKGNLISEFEFRSNE